MAVGIAGRRGAYTQIVFDPESPKGVHYHCQGHTESGSLLVQNSIALRNAELR
jgi:hypothetical protein